MRRFLVLFPLALVLTVLGHVLMPEGVSHREVLAGMSFAVSGMVLWEALDWLER